MDPKLLERINELARKSKETPLTEEELAEQAQLRAEYIKEYRAMLRGILENTVIQRPDGTREKLNKRSEK
ncbi:MAG: DUF896 domain-containing protein [Clostridia bacterium]|nr:DUF896 domain-containing protein [Clostridia bacterium]